MEEKRIDIVMLEKGMVKTRSQARMLIKQGDVTCNGKPVKKAGHLVIDSDDIQITQEELFVSRGAYKLVKALEEFQIDLNGKVIADCGASTGGFTQVSLDRGASKVYAIDVGRDQLDPIIKEDTRVINHEGINLKHPFELPEKVDFCVCDISFISIKKVFPTIKSLLKSDGYSIILIKPQFEAGPEKLGNNGVVKEKYQEQVLNETLDWFKDNGHTIEKLCESPIKGKVGNTEYLALIS